LLFRPAPQDDSRSSLRDFLLGADADEERSFALRA